MFNKKLLLILAMLFCIGSFKPANCNADDIKIGLKYIGVSAISALVAYGSNELLCKNNVYRRKINPIAKNACFLFNGSVLVFFVINKCLE